MRILLVEPDFPIADKSRNHAHFLPIGLLKIASYHKRLKDEVRLSRGLHANGFNPDRILITSAFTYWSKHVHDAARFYHEAYPKAQVEIGGIYATLMPEDCRKRSPFAIVSRGLYCGGVAEEMPPLFSLLKERLDYQIVHASRGCPRHCSFCGTWKIEPKFTCKNTVIPEIKKRRLIFYDNNLLANPHIDRILAELAQYRDKKGRCVSCESQSGLDLHHLTPERAKLLREAHFQNVRIAWDGGYSQWPKIRKAVRILRKAGYGRKEVFMFMLYNNAIDYKDMRKKLDACRRWKVRVIDCRYRPLNATEDGYRPGPKPQTRRDYYIYPSWTDRQVRGFRRAVRRQNIAILLDLPRGRYIDGCELRKVSPKAAKK